MEECHSRQLRPKTMLSYEHTLKLFSFWLTGRKKISRIEDIKEKHIREYIIELQTRGKYTVRPSGYEQNFPENRKDYEKPVSSIIFRVCLKIRLYKHNTQPQWKTICAGRATARSCFGKNYTTSIVAS